MNPPVYLVIGYSDTYADDGIEPYYVELRHENTNQNDKILHAAWTESDAQTKAQTEADSRNIPVLKDTMI